MLSTVGIYLVYLVCFIFSMRLGVLTASLLGFCVVKGIGYSLCLWKHKCQMFPIFYGLSLINTFTEGSHSYTLHIVVSKIQSLWHASGHIGNNF